MTKVDCPVPLNSDGLKEADLLQDLHLARHPDPLPIPGYRRSVFRLAPSSILTSTRRGDARLSASATPLREGGSSLSNPWEGWTT